MKKAEAHHRRPRERLELEPDHDELDELTAQAKRELDEFFHLQNAGLRSSAG